MENVGVIDLGTNTFHLLIGRLSAEGLIEVYRERIFVQLAEDGIQTIGTKAFERAVAALTHFKEVLDKYHIQKVKAFGTAALRTASNASELAQTIRDNTGLDIHIISGKEEARLIYEGVRQAVPFGENMDMIMDIGGGSVEFIIANQQGVQWAKSFPIGVAVLFNTFHQTDPIQVTEVGAIKNFLHQQLAPLIAVLPQFQLHRLIGASGTFDVLEKVLNINRQSIIHSSVDTDGFLPFYDTIIQSTLQERLDMDNIPSSRAQLIVVAIVLIAVILELTKIEQIDISAYAMKEGILSEM